MACPVCNAKVPPGASQCLVCRSSLAGLVGAQRGAAPSKPAAPSLGQGASGYARLPMGPLVGGDPPPPRPEVRSASPPRPPPSRAPAPVDDDELATADEVTHQRASFEVGALIRERYKLRRAMGEGVLGASWAARDMRTGSEVVLKVVADMLVTNERERSDLVGKLEMFAGRTLPGVVMPREVFAVPGSAVLVYPNIEAVSLRSVIDARRATGARCTPEECLRVAMALSAAIQAMHTASPHGALWPQNVLVTAKGILVVDGFVAVSVAPDRLATRIEHHPRAIPFAAPEILGGRRPTASADLYALGAIVAELAGGAPPGEGPDLASVSRELHRSVATLLDREPGRRPGGAKAVLEALTAAAGFERRPREPQLVVPESVLSQSSPQVDHVGAHPIDPPTLPAAERAPSQPSRGAPNPRPEPIAPATAESAPSAGPPGRLRGPTATLPASTQRPNGMATSGPPPSMSVKSGPPAAKPIAPQPIASKPVAPQPIASKPIGPQPVAPQPIAPQPIAPQPVAPQPIAPQPIARTALPQRPLSTAPAVGEKPLDGRIFPKTIPSINDALNAAARAARAAGPPARPSSPAPTSAMPPAPPRPPMGAPSPRVPPVPPASPRVPSGPLPPPRVSSGPLPPSARPPMPPARPPMPPRPPAGAFASPPPRSAAPPMPASGRLAPRPPPAERSLSDDDEIDPKLLRAARMLDDERRRDR